MEADSAEMEMDQAIEVIESKVIIKPDYRLESKGKKVDTIYIYTFKR